MEKPLKRENVHRAQFHEIVKYTSEEITDIFSTMIRLRRIQQKKKKETKNANVLNILNDSSQFETMA